MTRRKGFHSPPEDSYDVEDKGSFAALVDGGDPDKDDEVNATVCWAVIKRRIIYSSSYCRLVDGGVNFLIFFLVQEPRSWGSRMIQHARSPLVSSLATRDGNGHVGGNDEVNMIAARSREATRKVMRRLHLLRERQRR